MNAPPELSRRTFLAAAGAGLVGPRLAQAAEPHPRPVALGQKHHEAVNRKRRIAVQYDAWSQLGHDFAEWLDYRFDYIDEPGTQIDSIWWDDHMMNIVNDLEDDIIDDCKLDEKKSDDNANDGE